MKKSSLSLIVALLSIAAFPPCATAEAHFQEQAYRYKDCDGKPAIARIPMFVDEAGGSGAMIDDYIHMAFLTIAPPVKPGTVPLPVATGSFFDSGVGNFEAKVADVLGGRVVEVSFSWNECDMVVDSAAAAYSFDARTGRLIAERDLFTPDGKTKLQRLLAGQRRQRLAEEIRRQDRRIAQAKNKPDRQRAESTKELYEQCLDDRFDPEKPVKQDLSLGMDGFSERGISFKDLACSTQADAALDELGPFADSVALVKLKPYLSAYGRYLFFGEGDGAIAADSATAQFFHGKVGDATVSLYLGADQAVWNGKGPLKFYTGAYFYDKYRTLIPLAVNPQSGMDYVFEERDAELRVTATFSVKVDKTGLRGTWRSGSRRLPVEAASAERRQ
jgi:hypothetical protein